MIISNGYTLVSPVCEFRQSGDRLAGTCSGPNGGGNAVGLAGVSSFQERLGADGVVRGTWTFSGRPGVRGEFTAQRP